jgi:thiamine kinase-like enzyme
MLNPISDIVRAPYLGVARDGDAFAILMPDLSGVLFDWSAPIRIDQLDRVLEGLAVLHAEPFEEAQLDGASCPIRERVALICRSSLERPGPQRGAVADRLLPGWDAFDREASAAARDVVDRLDADPTPLVQALEGRERRLIHGDLKLANAGVAADGRLDIVDWQMVSVGPIAIELGWFLVANVASLPLPPPEVVDRYARWLDRGSLDPDDGWIRPDFKLERDDVDLAILVGLLLRGWRKGYDAEAGITLASGVTARDDLAWWCDRAVEAAARVL